MEAIQLEEKENHSIKQYMSRKGKQVSAGPVMVDDWFLFVILVFLCFVIWTKLS